MTLPADLITRYAAIHAHADEGGVIQAADMPAHFSEPRRHTTVTLRTVARWLVEDAGLLEPGDDPDYDGGFDPIQALIESAW